MKKVISIVISIVLIITMFGAVSVSAEIKFKDSTTFYEEFKNADDVPCTRYYKTVNGVVYSCIDNPDYGLSDAEVVAIMPAEKNSKDYTLKTLTLNKELKLLETGELTKLTTLNIDKNIK